MIYRKTNEQIEEYILKLIVDYVEGVNVDLKVEKDKYLKTDLCLDSLDIIDITREIEIYLDIIIPDYEYHEIKTVGDIISVAQKLYSKKKR